MKFWITACVGVVLVTGIITGVFLLAPDLKSAPKTKKKETPSERPRAVTEKTEDTVPNVSQNQTGENTFKISNQGNAPLILNEIHAQCTCADAKLKKAGGDEVGSLTLEPNEEATFIVRWDSKQRVSDFPVTAQVKTNDRERPLIHYTVKLQIKEWVAATHSGNIEFGTLTGDEGRSQRIGIYSPLRDDLVISSAADTSPEVPLKVTYEKLTADEAAKMGGKSGVKALITVPDGMPVGPFSRMIRFHTNIPQAPTRDVTVHGEIMGKMRTDPEFADFRVVDASAGKTIRILVMAALEEGETFVRAEPDAKVKFVTTKLEAHPRSKHMWFLTVGLSPDSPAGDFRGVIGIHDNKNKNRLSIPVRGRVNTSTAAR